MFKRFVPSQRFAAVNWSRIAYDQPTSYLAANLSKATPEANCTYSERQKGMIPQFHTLGRPCDFRVLEKLIIR
jgi:hypothetical protein